MIAAKEKGILEDARKQFVQGLYEIQRGGNLSFTGEDNMDDDSPICIRGMINKLIESTCGYHSDCRIEYITRETASLKLPIVVKEEAINYLKSLSKSSALCNDDEFNSVILDVQNNGVEAIWSEIKERVSQRIFEEFNVNFSLQMTQVLSRQKKQIFQKKIGF